jgi:hypothetical protein
VVVSNRKSNDGLYVVFLVWVSFSCFVADNDWLLGVENARLRRSRRGWLGFDVYGVGAVGDGLTY